MGIYKLHVLDPSDAIVRILECEERDDLAALDAARALAARNTIEIWSDNGRVARVKAGNEPSNSGDSVSG